ncbi:response regulator [Pseudomonas sp. EL_65y_Pfl2_R95]|uniref:response regulator n=1 Tax=Pseudomonas sp. EL_65y_Pfl2_R95 TaxID=3088698 RepID=UPI0030D9BEB7
MQNGTDGYSANPHTILVVEDDAVVRTLTLEVLEAFGYQAFGAEDGDTALSILRSEQALSLLMTDIGLPDISGLDLAQQAQVLRPEIAVLLASGYEVQQQTSTGNGAVATITKPFQLDLLRSTLQAMLGQ